MSQLSPVTFHGDTIFCLTHENQPYTPAKSIVENLGLGWASQSQKLNSNKARWGVTIIVIPSESGVQQMLCLPVRKLPAYLSSINPKKVRPELRAKIELYQAESDDALWNYWINGRAERAKTEPVISSPISKRTDPERKALTSIINTWVGMAPVHYASARAQVNAHFGVTSVDELTVAQVKEAIQWVQAKIDAVSGPARTPVLPASNIYADRVKALTDLEKRFMEFSVETRTRLSALNAEYIRLNQGAYAAMLGMIPTMDFAAKDRLIDALTSQSYDAYNLIEDGLRCMRRVIIAARAANRVLSGRS